MKFHFTQAVCGIREQYSLERAQGMGGKSQKLTCASTALDSKSEKSDVPFFARSYFVPFFARFLFAFSFVPFFARSSFVPVALFGAAPSATIRISRA